MLSESNFNMSEISQHKIFISTRAEDSSNDLRTYIEKHGAMFLEFPMIKTIALEPTAKEVEILKQLKLYNWLVFTSANGVNFFLSLMKEKQLPETMKIATIGKKTAQALIKHKINVDYIGTSNESTEFAIEFKNLLKTEDKVIWPTSKLAGTSFINTLKDFCDITRIDIYDTVLPTNFNPETEKRIVEGRYTLIYFFSSSAVHNFAEAFKNKLDLNKLKAACIGNVTASTCNELGIKPLVIASKPNSEVLFDESVKIMMSNR